MNDPHPNQPAGQRLLDVVKMTAISLGLAIALAELHDLVDLSVGVPWVSAALCHTLISVFVVFWYVRKKRLSQILSLSTESSAEAPAALRRLPGWAAWMPTVAVIGGTITLALISRLAGGASLTPGPGTVPAWIVWIPVVEEIVFRAGLTEFMRRHWGSWPAVWFSAVSFSYLHSAPTLDALISMNTGLPPGPFLLGLATGILWIWTGRVMPAITLHAACNGTVVVFSLIDDRWLGWLSWLYS